MTKQANLECSRILNKSERNEVKNKNRILGYQSGYLLKA